MISKKKKLILCEYIDYICEQCKRQFVFQELEIHRINRGNVGGDYSFRNCMILCVSCHKKLHQMEFGHISNNSN